MLVLKYHFKYLEVASFFLKCSMKYMKRHMRGKDLNENEEMKAIFNNTIKHKNKAFGFKSCINHSKHSKHKNMLLSTIFCYGSYKRTMIKIYGILLYTSLRQICIQITGNALLMVQMLFLRMTSQHHTIARVKETKSNLP